MWLQHAHGHGVSTHYAHEHVHTSLLYLGNGWTDCAQICYVNRDRYDMRLRQSNGGAVHVRTCTLHLLFRVLAWIGWFIVDDCGISSRHDTCKLLCDTSLALARSSPTRRYTGKTCLYLYARRMDASRFWNVYKSVFVTNTLICVP